MNRWPKAVASTVLFVLAFAATATSAESKAAVAPFTATYEVRRNGDLLGEATLRLAAEGANWRFSSETRGTHGLARAAGVRIDESSLFGYTPKGPETLEYAYRQRTSFNSRERGAQVDARSGRIALRNRDERNEVPYVSGVVDRQLVTVALMQAVAAGQRGELHFNVVGRHAVEPQAWVVGALEAVPLGEGREQGLRIERRRDTPDGRSTLLWLDSDQGHLPLRIEQREDDGESIEMRLIRRG